ncbi:MAG TPA: NAD-dependent epimerase/dehydratase family protein [Polyangia bacterium]|nr:NAD-dependent epimerase/dehydratase family protein [Polyangia bacterium]
MARRKKSSTQPSARSFDPGERVVAVTGAYSFVGGELIKRLEEDRRYYKVLAIDIRKPAFPLTKTQFHKVDLTLPTADAELSGILKREGVETFVHAAFLSAPTHNATWAHEFESIGTVHVLNACGEAKIRKFILWSSTVVYGAAPLNPNFLTEDAELRGHPRSRFINDKAEAERETARFAKENRDTTVTVLRTAPILGPRIRNYVTRFFARPACPTLMGYDPLMQFVHEDDAVDAFKLASDEDFAGAFNIVGDGVLPYSTILAMMGKVPLPVPHFVAYPLAQALWATQVFDSPPNFLDFLRYLCVADGSRAREVMGFRPHHDIKSAILDFLGVAAERHDLASEEGRA